MEFGDRARFAVIVELDSNHGGSWLFGRICYWIKGKMIGQFDLGTSLRDVLFQSKYIDNDRGKRFCPDLARLPNNKIFNLISSALNEVGDEIYQHIPKNFPPGRFDVCIHVDVFDCWKVFLVEGEKDAKLLFCKLDTEEIDAAILFSGEFDRIFRNAYEYIEYIYDKEVISDTHTN